MFVWPCKNSLLSARKISVNLVTELPCRKVLRATMASLLQTSRAKGKPVWLPFPVSGEQIGRDMLLSPYMRAGLPLSVCLGKSAKVLGET